MKQSIRPRGRRKARNKFLVVEYDVILLFGLTELKAQIAWTENVSR